MKYSQLLLCAALPGMTAAAPQAQETPSSYRWEVSLNFRNWNALDDLQPVAGGSFDTLGFGLAGAVHWPVKRFENSELLLGFDAGIMASDSSVPGLLNDLLVRQLVIGPSVKWRFGEQQLYSLDAGLTYHLLDIAEVDSGYGASGLELEYFEKNKIAPYVGATWDINAGRVEKNVAYSVALKLHFVDFGTARDEDSLLSPVLGANAGKLDGPILVLQFGMSGW